MVLASIAHPPIPGRIPVPPVPIWAWPEPVQESLPEVWAKVLDFPDSTKVSGGNPHVIDAPKVANHNQAEDRGS